MSKEGCTVGRVVSVSGAQVVFLLNKPEEREQTGDSASPIEVGSVVKICGRHSQIVGMIRAVSIPMPSEDTQSEGLRIGEVELLGEITTDRDGSTRDFQRGVSFFPALGDEVALTTQDDLREIYAVSGPATACVGRVHQQESLPAHVQINDMLGKHFAVLGTTGSGKSCAVTVMLKAAPAVLGLVIFPMAK